MKKTLSLRLFPYGNGCCLYFDERTVVETSLDDFSMQMKEISADNARLLKEFNIKMQELRDSQAETDRQIKQIKKSQAETNDAKQLLRKKSTFRENFPEHNNKKLYLAMASRSFHHLTEKACKDNGIAIMKQVDGTVVISDENLKVFQVQ